MTNIAISSKVVGVTLSGHQRLNRYTDEELAAFVERCQEQPRHWHVMFRHAGIQGARQKVFRVNHDPRFSKLPLDYRAIRTPQGLIDTAAHHVGGYVVARYSKNKAKLGTRTEYFVDCSALTEPQMITLLDAITNGTVFKVPQNALTIGIGHIEEEELDDADVYGETSDPDSVSDETPALELPEEDENVPPATGSDAHLEGEDDATEQLLSSPKNAARLDESMDAIRRGDYTERELIDTEGEDDEIF